MKADPLKQYFQSLRFDGFIQFFQGGSDHLPNYFFLLGNGGF